MGTVIPISTASIAVMKLPLLNTAPDQMMLPGPPARESNPHKSHKSANKAGSVFVRDIQR